MESDQPIDRLSFENNALLDSKGKVVATLSKNLGSADLSRYAHLFVTALQLLNFLEDAVSSAIEAAQVPRRPSAIRYVPFEARLPNWIDSAVHAIALADGDPSNINEEKLSLSLSETEDNALEDSEGEVVVRLSEQLDDAQIHDYLYLFLASSVLLQIVEAMEKKGLAEIDQGYESGKEFDPSGADASRFIVPDRLRSICDLVAKAKGVASIPVGPWKWSSRETQTD